MEKDDETRYAFGNYLKENSFPVKSSRYLREKLGERGSHKNEKHRGR